MLKERKVVQGLVGSLDQMEYLDKEDLKVLKENKVHLDQGQKEFRERRYHTNTEFDK